MDRPSNRDHVVEQFSYSGEAGAIWRGFDAILDTDGYLNLGYSGRLQSHLLGSPQGRLAGLVIDHLADAGVERGDRVLDVGCGRGGPASRMHDRLGVRCVGLDLVPHNLHLARSGARTRPDPPGFVQGDATTLPLAGDALDAATAIDALVYVDDVGAAFGELTRTLRPDGVAVITDLLRREVDSDGDAALARLSRRWGFPGLRTAAEYRRTLEAAGLSVTETRDLRPHSIGRFRRWTSAYRALATAPFRRALGGLAARRDLDLDAIERQIDAAHAALPYLTHRLFVVTPA